MIRTGIVALVAAAAGFAGLAQAATINLFERSYHIDGVNTLNGVPATGVDESAFDTTTGLGSIEVTVGGAGAHTVILFADLEIDEAINSFFNEFGATSGAPAAGQSWEIDEPGFLFGNIYINLQAGSLDNSNGVPAGLPDDVSMAIGWDFILGPDEEALITFLLSETLPSGFHLFQTDPDSDATVYFSSSLSIRQVQELPEPAAALLFGLGLAALGFLRRTRTV